MSTADLPNVGGSNAAGPEPDPIDPNEAARVRRGASAASPPDVLRELANDSSITVRAALALNPAAPTRVNRLLAHDSDERVRILLARKLAALAPSLSVADQSRLQCETWDLLTALVADEAVRVRAAIADVVKDLADVPRELILRLAGDLAFPVSGPVIRLSPLLTSGDLLALLAAAPRPEVSLAVAGRAHLDEAVSDAIAATADSTAIRALLANPSAQIREATLDTLVARSVNHVDWHEPLVQRPALPPRAARMLSEIVATHLLEILATRADLTPSLAEELRGRLAVRLTLVDPAPLAKGDTTPEQAYAQARALAERGKLSEETILEAARRGEARYATALLAIAAGLPVSAVERAAALRSAKGLVSLAWKAGFTMRTAGALQSLLARIAPELALTAGPSGSFPLTIEEMRWQLDFLGRMGR